jgi:hypothetical protein
MMPPWTCRGGLGMGKQPQPMARRGEWQARYVLGRAFERPGNMNHSTRHRYQAVLPTLYTVILAARSLCRACLWPPVRA